MQSTFTEQGMEFLDISVARDVVKEVIVEDCYRINEIPEGSIVIDAGAMFGEFGIACNLKRFCKIIFIEPSIESVEILRRNLLLNDIESDCAVINVALASDDRIETFIASSIIPQGNVFASLTHNHSDGNALRYPVRCMTIPEIIKQAQTKFGADRKVCLKMDCEGVEKELFCGNLEWLNKIYSIMMEWHYYDGHVYANILKGLGFYTRVLEGSGPPPRPAWNPTICGGLLIANRL